MKNRYILSLLLSLGSYFLFAQEKPELVIQMGHTGSINSVSYTPNGRQILTGGRHDHTLKLWDAQSGMEIRTFIGHSSDVNSAAISPDGKVAISGCADKTLKLWDLSTGKEIKTLTGHQETVKSVAFFPDGQSVVSGSWDKTIRIWDIKSGTQTLSIVNNERVLAIAVSPDGNYILSGAMVNVQNLQLWNARTGQKGMALNGHTRIVNDVAFSANGKLALSASGDSTLRVWSVEDGRLIRTIKTSSSVLSCKFSPDGRFVLSGNYDRTMRLFELSTGVLVKSFDTEKNSEPSVVFSPDGRYALSTGYKYVKIWEIASGKEIQRLKGNVESLTAAKFDNTGDRVLTGAYETDGSEYYLRLWDATNGRQVLSIPGHSNWISSVAFSSNPHYAVSGSADKTVKIWDLSSGTLLRSMSHLSAVRSVAFSPNGEQVLSGSWDESVRVWDATTGARKITMYPKSCVLSVAFSPDGQSILSGGEKTLLKLWDANSGKEKFSLLGHFRKYVTSVAFSPDGTKGLSGGDDKRLMLWDLNTGQEIKIFTTYHTGEVNSVAFSQNGKLAVSGSDDKTAKIWDLSTGQEITSLKGHLQPVSSAVFSPNGNQVLTCSKDGTFRFWNTSTGEEILTCAGLNDGKNWIVSTPDGFYQGSRGAFNKLHYIKGNDVYTFDQFDLQYNRPDIVLARLGKASPELINSYKKAYEKRLKKMGFDPANFENERSFNVPKISLVNQSSKFIETTQKEFTVSIKGEDKLFNLDRLFVEVNGIPLYGVKGKSLKANNLKTTLQTIVLTLTKGKNIIKASILNEKGVESLAERIEVNYQPSVHTKPNLYVIAIGVSEFENTEFNLRYAAKDADDLTNLLASKKDMYEKIQIQKITNQQATRSNILKTKEALLKSSVDDEVIVFVASHGLLDDKFDYYIATHDVTFENPSVNGLKYEELENLLDGIPARKKLLLIDACHSGEVDKEEGIVDNVELPQTEQGVKARGFKKLTKTKQNVGLINSFELMKELFADLRRGTGAVVISSASGKEFAFESSEWTNGVFTYSLLEGLKSGKADLNKDQKTQVSELRDYVSQRVRELTNGQQNPTSRSENLESDFSVW